MGTSTSQASPATTNWRIARALLGKKGVTPSQQSAELWRAAVADRGARLLDSLASPVLAHAARLAGSVESPIDAVRAFDTEIHRSGAADLTLEMGRRALARAVASHEGTPAFAAELFAEAAGYYVARDLASFIGSRDGVSTTSQGFALKEGIREIARVASLSAGEAPTAADRWSGYVRKVVELLQQRVPPAAGETRSSRSRRRS